MTKQIAAHRLDVRAFAQANSRLQGAEPLERFARVLEVSAAGVAHGLVHWSAQGEVRVDQTGQSQYWLRLLADAEVTQTCQRCLAPIQVPVHVDRWFRFVADEATATAQDEICEEDILALEPDFSLHELIQDELLLELPYIPRHEVCPDAAPMSAADPGFEEPTVRPNPFAALAGLKAPKGGGTG